MHCLSFCQDVCRLVTLQKLAMPFYKVLTFFIKVLVSKGESFSFSDLTRWLCSRKGIRPVKKLSGGVLAWLSVWSICRLAYGPADATATHCLLLQ